MLVYVDLSFHKSIFQSKGGYFEGGIRGVGVIWTQLFKGRKPAFRHMFSLEDWVPTIIGAVEKSDEDQAQHSKFDQLTS